MSAYLGPGTGRSIVQGRIRKERLERDNTDHTFREFYGKDIQRGIFKRKWAQKNVYSFSDSFPL